MPSRLATGRLTFALFWDGVCAGVGSDPREDRYFNVVKQSVTYDAEARYMKHWVPEMASLPKEFCHHPFQMDDAIRRKYNVSEEVRLLTVLHEMVLDSGDDPLHNHKGLERSSYASSVTIHFVVFVSLFRCTRCASCRSSSPTSRRPRPSPSTARNASGHRQQAAARRAQEGERTGRVEGLAAGGRGVGRLHEPMAGRLHSRRNGPGSTGCSRTIWDRSERHVTGCKYVSDS